MMRYLLVVATGVSMLTLTSCKRDKEVSLQVNATFGEEPLQFDKDYINSQGLRVQFTDIKFFVTDLHFSGGDAPVQSVRYFDLKGERDEAIYDIPKGSYDAASFMVGVNPADNAKTPAQYAVNDELGNQLGGQVYWDWMGSYVFVTIEGRFDSLPVGSGTPAYPFSYHVGGDEHLKSLSAEGLGMNLKKSGYQLNLDLDMAEFFHATDTIRLGLENVTHSNPGQEVITQKVRDNFAASLTLR